MLTTYAMPRFIKLNDELVNIDHIIKICSVSVYSDGAVISVKLSELRDIKIVFDTEGEANEYFEALENTLIDPKN